MTGNRGLLYSTQTYHLYYKFIIDYKAWLYPTSGFLTMAALRELAPYMAAINKTKLIILNSVTFLMRDRNEKLLIRLLHRAYMSGSLPLHQVGVPEKKQITRTKL